MVLISLRCRTENSAVLGFMLEACLRHLAQRPLGRGDGCVMDAGGMMAAWADTRERKASALISNSNEILVDSSDLARRHIDRI